jgi:phenylpyruvate tautomerase PptA (4-oxalocrotonate tautomerase family)
MVPLRVRRACAFAGAWLALSFPLCGADEKSPPHAAAGHTAGPGIKKELIEGITEADFLKLGDEPKSVHVTIVAVYSDANYGMNFNGYSHGKAAYTVPTGWTVHVTFINPSPVPHSLIVVERDVVKKIQMGDPAFAGASVPKPTEGLSLAKATFSFVASEAGDYALACGFPTHALNGHWIAFNVRDAAQAATLQLGDSPVRTAK